MKKSKTFTFTNAMDIANQEVDNLIAFFTEHKVPSKEFPHLRLCLDEVLTNIINYGFSDDTQHQITMIATVDKDHYTVTTKDKGIAFDPTQKESPDTTLSVEERPIGGLGVFLVKELMDSVAYSREGDYNILKMVKKF